MKYAHIKTLLRAAVLLGRPERKSHSFHGGSVIRTALSHRSVGSPRAYRAWPLAWPQTSGSWRCETVKCSAEPLISPSKDVSLYGHVAQNSSPWSTSGGRILMLLIGRGFGGFNKLPQRRRSRSRRWWPFSSRTSGGLGPRRRARRVGRDSGAHSGHPRRDPAAKRSFRRGRPARVQVGDCSGCPWMTASDRSFPPVLARA